MAITYTWRGAVHDDELNEVQAEAFATQVLHVDFDQHLRSFYLDACGFTVTPVGVIRL